ncbi:hypothetical protein PCANC_17692 [Puccinia coronata f. sp. avenae]|uniref:Uncharacterized protein n=1 Tax=Puccinia coronata f. sp. avenae TaxID=200324 RepID=A0A2N5U965_9BASI|nr:hypothetical protein PCANC_17692 [Puccinia coronata f. sp. avenae]
MARTFCSSNEPPPPPPPPEINNAPSNNAANSNKAPSSVSLPPKPQIVPQLNSSKGSTKPLPSYLQPKESFPLAPLPPSDLMSPSSEPPTTSMTQPPFEYTRVPVHSQASQAAMEQSREEGRRILPALPRSSAFAELESSLPPLMGFDELDHLTEAHQQYDPHRGVTPSEVNSRAASIALASTRSTPVPWPIERQEFLVSRRDQQPPPPPRPTESTTPVQNQLVLCEMTEVPRPPDPAETISDVFHGQWLLFVNAKEQNDCPMMQLALNQAISSQDALESFLGTQRMLEISEGWIAREDLALLDQDSQALTTPRQEPALDTRPYTSPYPQNPALHQRLLPQNKQLTLPDVDTRMRPASTNQIPAQQAHVPPLLAPVPTRPPTGHQVMPMVVEQILPQRQDYQAPLQHVMTPPVHQPAHPYYGQEYYANHLHQHQLNYPPQEQFPPPHGGHQYTKQPHLTGPQYHRPYQRNQENSWRRRYNPMASMMQMGTFFMRAERTMSRMQRLRYRGRSYRGNLGNNQPPPPPGNYQ